MTINGLVDYNSSSSDEEDKSKKSTTTLITKKKKITTRIFIDPLPKNQPTTSEIITKTKTNTNTNTNTNTTNDETKTKKLITKRPASSGLASLLPPPKRTQINKEEVNQKPTSAPINPSSSQPPSDPSPSKSILQQTSSSISPLNLFGLPNPSSLPTPPDSSQINQTIIPSSIPISSAPQVTEETAPEPSLLDPYPGYWQRKDGTWVQRNPEDPIWKAFYSKNYDPNRQLDNLNGDQVQNQLPKDFFKDSPGLSSSHLIEFNAKKEAQLAWENKPKIINPRLEARQEQATSKPAAKYISSRARGRHQLTSLLTDAQANRAELEDRIAHGKLNRKAGGAKYGF